MGCGGSRLNAEREAIPAKVQPLLRRRIEEIRRRRRSNGGKDTAPSGTELLLSRDGKARDDEDEIENSMVSCVTSEDSKGSTAKRAEAGDPQREESAKEKSKEGGKEEKVAKGNVEAGSQNDAKEEDESHGNKEDDEGLHGDESSILFPGSPSFRIYFTDNLDEDDDDDDNDNDGG